MQYCLECGDKIIGRADKKFCNDACRNAYNNSLNKDTNNTMRIIQRILRNNYRVLSSLNFTDGKAKSTKEKLSSSGFDFEYFTHFKKYKNGAEYRFVFDIGYKFLEDGWLLVVRKEK